MRQKDFWKNTKHKAYINVLILKKQVFFCFSTDLGDVSKFLLICCFYLQQVCGRSNEVENTNFVDSYKHFSHHDSKYGDLLKFLWENPATVGQCIYEGEKMGFPGMDHVITTITASVYGGCMFREDESAMLSILKLLTELQVCLVERERREKKESVCV